MSKQLYLECYSGISGDMTVAALLDLGVEEDYLRRELDKLHLEGYEIKIGKTKKNQITALDFDVILKDSPAEHGHAHGHEHNSYEEIREFIMKSELNEKVKNMTLKIFEVIAEAEAKVHDSTLEQVHFHEVGAVDSIVDITAAAICLDKLGFDTIITSELWEGKGTTWCQHGRIPVPAPAVLEMFAKYRMPVSFTPTEGEMITPTGAGIVAALSERKPLPKRFVIEKTGIGAGKKDFSHANILRAMIINTQEERQQENARDIVPDRECVCDKKAESKKNRVCVLESNVDDCSGEQLGYTMESLLEAGALDVSCMPLYMKKNRPAYMLQVICRVEDEGKMEGIIFRETTSIGIRKYTEERSILPREFLTVTLPGGQQARVKKCSHHGQVFYYPEYDTVTQICRETGNAYREIYREIAELAADEGRTDRS